MYNNTDVTYSFNLDNYINSLESNYSFNDYKILVNNKDYNTLSLEHERLIIDINNRINSIDTLSIESFSSNISKFVSWFKDMINRLITMISTFIKRIIAKIYELTLRFNNKDDIYHEFKSQIFTSVNIPIKDKKLNPNMMNDMEEYIQRINDWNESFKGELETKRVSENFDTIYENAENDDDKLKYLYGNDYKSEMNELLSNLKEDGIGNYIDKIFYSESKKSNTTIREYFGCNAGQTPKQLIILSKEYTDKLVKVKNETQQFLNELVKKKKDLISIMEKEKLDEERVNHYKNIIKNITYFHNMNYTFFIKAIRVRGKVAKYILKGSLGGLFESIEGLVTGEEYKEKETHLEVFRELPEYGKGEKQILWKDDRGRCTIEKKEYEQYHIPLDNEYVIMYAYPFDEPEAAKQLKKELNEIDSQLQKANWTSKEKTTLLKRLWTLLEIPIDFSFLSILECSIQHQGEFCRIYVTCSVHNHKLTEDDKLYHTSTVKGLKQLSSYTGGKLLQNICYSEPRIYFGLNQIMAKNTHLPKTDWKSLIDYIVRLPQCKFGGRKDGKDFRVYVSTDKFVGKYVYGDPEMYFSSKTKNSFEKINKGVDDENYRIETRMRQSVFLPYVDKVNVIDITALIRSYKEMVNN